MPWAHTSMVDPGYFPKGAVLEQVDVIQLGKSINFCIAPFDGAPHCKIGDERSVFASRDQANQLSHDLCRVLRHKIGNCRGSAFRCDEGGWVDIDAIINDRNNDIFPPTTSKAKRYMGIMEVIKWQESGHRKSRFQVLAARFPSIMNPNDMKAAKEELSYLGLGRDDIERVFNRCDGWFRPWCIRVTTGHSDFGFMSSSALANRYSARMGDTLGGAFHVTYLENLPSIVRCGLVFGGIDGGNRLALHFGAFAPWDEMNVATKTTLRNLRTSRSMRSNPFGLARATEGNAWSTRAPSGRTQNVWRMRSARDSLVLPRSRPRCSFRTSQRSSRECLKRRRVPTICTTFKAWWIVPANCFGKTSYKKVLASNQRNQGRDQQNHHPERRDMGGATMPNLSVMCNRDSYVLLCVSGMWSAINLYREILHPHWFRR